MFLKYVFPSETDSAHKRFLNSLDCINWSVYVTPLQKLPCYIDELRQENRQDLSIHPSGLTQKQVSILNGS